MHYTLKSSNPVETVETATMQWGSNTRNAIKASTQYLHLKFDTSSMLNFKDSELGSQKKCKSWTGKSNTPQREEECSSGLWWWFSH